MAARKLTILFSGMIAADPGQGGAAWAVLQYLLGFRRLGHAVYFIEPIKRASLRPATCSLGESQNARYFREVAREFQLERCSALLLDGETETIGLGYADLLQIARRADVLINVSGMLTDRAILDALPVRVYLDLDPAFVQMWHAVQGVDMRFDAHTHFVTVGQAIGRPMSAVPTCGLEWIKTLQPVVLEQWPAIGPGGPVEWNALTTVANFRGYGSIEQDGVLYGQKVHSLRQLMHLPRLTREKILLAMTVHPAETRDRSALTENGWQLIDPAEVASTPGRYRRFVQRSRAELGVAKSGYVASWCAWFSDRSACYLASGRPVVAQETGFGDHLPTGAGLFSFTTAEEAAAAIEAMSADYARHCRAARSLAEGYFDSDLVLTGLLRNIEVAP